MGYFFTTLLQFFLPPRAVRKRIFRLLQCYCFRTWFGLRFPKLVHFSLLSKSVQNRFSQAVLMLLFRAVVKTTFFSVVKAFRCLDTLSGTDFSGFCNAFASRRVLGSNLLRCYSFSCLQTLSRTGFSGCCDALASGRGLC